MTTQSQLLSSTAATNITTSKSLANGTSYSFQVSVGSDSVSLAEATSPPALNTTDKHTLRPGEWRHVKQGSAGIYAWADTTTPSYLVITEAP